MAGRLRSCFRFGNLAEHLGILLLKGVAAVADVPRTEDVGLDAVASLLRRDEDGNCYAEDNFVVQLKSESETSLEYRDHALKWLLGQTQPMFIGRISLRESRISLYPTLYVNQAVLSLKATRIVIRFGTSGIPPLFAGGQSSAWVGGPDDTATVWLGEPLLDWTLGSMTDQQWLISAYEILKRFLKIARLEYEMISFRQCSQLAWATNDKESIRAWPVMRKAHADDLRSTAQRCMPGLHSLLMCASAMPEQSGSHLAFALVDLAVALRGLGAEIDPEHIFSKLASTVRR